MGLLGRKRRFALGVAILAVLIPSTGVQAAEAGSVTGEIGEGQEEAYLELTEIDGEYEVSPGDCLWSIAEKVWGDGSLYENLIAYNQEIISDPDMIYPGTCLSVKRSVYIRKQNPYGKNSMWGYEFPTPGGSVTGIREFGDSGANFCMSGNGVIACLVQDKEKAFVETTSDWSECMQRLEKYAEENYEGQITELVFEHYQSLEEEDIYLYSYQYKADLAEYGVKDSISVYVCVGMKLTEHMQAEFVGFDFDQGINDTVRGVTAGFNELPNNGDFPSVNGSNMAIWPSNEWDLDGMYNAFAWIEDSFEYLLGKAMTRQEEQEESMTSKYHF